MQGGAIDVTQHPIYRNALDAIQVGVEDFNEGSPPRLASAVRNLVAGILLLCKEKLRRLSPDDEILIWKQIVPSLDDIGTVVFTRAGKTTVDVGEIIARFNSCKIEVDADLLQRITKVRNAVEHHYVAEADQIRGAFADGLLFLSKFMPAHLGVDPQDEIDEDAWSSLIEQKEIEDRLRSECRASYAALNWSAVMKEALENEGCPECNSHLIRQVHPENKDPFNATWSCRACGHSQPNAEWMGQILPAHFSGASFLAAKDGGNDPLDTCPECGESAYVYSEEMCLSCGFELGDPGECLVCGESLGLEDYGENLCSYHRYVADRERDS
jgi:DNA-directed RNA polymerase subunit M/transcription elongation factor TFIIS